MDREAFQEKLDELDAVSDERVEFINQAIELDSGNFDFGRQDPAEEYDFDILIEACEKLKELYLDKFPRRRKVTTTRIREDLDVEESEELFERYKEEFEAKRKEYEERRDTLEEELTEAAEKLEVRENSDCEMVIDTSSTSTYRSQGMGKHKYAKNALKTTLVKAKYHGIEAEIRDISDSDDYVLADYAVFARVDELDSRILEYKPEPPLRETLKELLQSGANPRVYFPHMRNLDKILDELGLDHFGREKNA